MSDPEISGRGKRKEKVCVCGGGGALVYNMRTIKSVAVKVNTKSKLKFAVSYGLHFIRLKYVCFFLALC